MTDQIFDRYKHALKAGHVAVLRGRLEEALKHYREASSLAASRALPHSSAAGVLLRLGQVDESISTYREALIRAPDDEASLSGLSEALVAAGQRAEASEVLDRLADVQLRATRTSDSLATRNLARTIRTAEATASARAEEEAALSTAAAEEDAPTEVAPGPEVAAADGSDAEAGRDARSEPTSAGDVVELSAAYAEIPEVADVEPATIGDAEPATTGEAEDGPPAAAAVPRAEQLAAEGEAALDSGDRETAASAFVEAAAAFVTAGALDAAIDACQNALTAAPGSAQAHLWLARLYFDRGWHDRAVDKVLLLDRLLALEGTPGVREEMIGLIHAQAPEEPRLAALVAPPMVSVGPESGAPAATAG